MRKYDIDKGRYFGQRWQASVLIVLKYNLAHVRVVCHTNRNVRKVWFLEFFKKSFKCGRLSTLIDLNNWLFISGSGSIFVLSLEWSVKHAPNRENRVRTSRRRPRAALNWVIELDRKAKGALLRKKKLLYYRCSTSYPGQFTDWRNWQGHWETSLLSKRFRAV